MTPCKNQKHPSNPNKTQHRCPGWRIIYITLTTDVTMYIILFMRVFMPL